MARCGQPHHHTPGARRVLSLLIPQSNQIVSHNIRASVPSIVLSVTPGIYSTLLTRWSGPLNPFPSDTSHHVLVYCGTSHRCFPKFRAGVPRTIPSVLVYHIPSQVVSWGTVYHPKSRARISCTIKNSELGYFVPSQGIYWYILGQIRGRGPGFGLLGRYHLSGFQPRS